MAPAEFTAPANPVPPSPPVHFELDGGAWGLFWRSFGSVLCSLLIIPFPWVATWFYRWVFGHIRGSDGAQITFSGAGGQMWWVFMALGVVNYASQINLWWVILLTFPITSYLTVQICRWLCANLALSSGSGNNLQFTGHWMGYLGRSILLILSFLTIIGWAWVSRWMMRWLAENVRGRAHKLAFHGGVWDILWRTTVFILSAFLIVPIPWTNRWLLRWYLANLMIVPLGSSQRLSENKA